MALATYKILLDTPSPEPALNFDQYALALKEIIATSDARFAVGIFGKWGSGKTTLMQKIQTMLRDQEQIIVVEFSAWRYEKEEDLIIPLLDVLRERLLQWSAERKTEKQQVAYRAASTLGKVMTAILAGMTLKVGFPHAVELSIDANKALTKGKEISKEEADATIPRSFYHASFQAMSEAFGEFGARDGALRIVVFVDDLDRCLPEGALQVLESMKLFFDFEGFIFVVGLDDNVVKEAIEARFQKEYPHEPQPMEGSQVTRAVSRTFRAEDYIKKIFQVPFTLAPVTVNQVNEFLNSFIRDGKLSPEQETDLKQRVRPHLRFIVEDTGVNPREIKRFVNAYTLSRMIKPHLDPDTLLTIQTITFRASWSGVRNMLNTFREEFVSAVQKRVNGTGDPLRNLLEGLDPATFSVPDTFLDYVTLPAPGKALFQTLVGQPLAEYIYGGAVTSSTLSPVILDVFPILRRLVASLAELRQSDEKRQAADLVIFHTETSQLQSMLSPVSSRRDSELIARDLEELRENLPSPNVPITLEWIQKTETTINRLLRHLSELLTEN